MNLASSVEIKISLWRDMEYKCIKYGVKKNYLPLFWNIIYHILLVYYKNDRNKVCTYKILASTDK